jgi:YebC/PmpR family DNA-binding regulatory protein
MGRKAAKVAAKKQKGEAKRTKLYGKYGKLIVAAVKEGGGADPVSNTQLARVLADAARLSVPRDLVDRNIKRATDGSQADYMELTYEAYGEGGVGIVIEVLSDNVNRAAADTKATVNKNGGKVAEPGSVLFNFERKGVITIDCALDEEEDVFEVACENGGDDVVPREDGEQGFTIYTEVQGFMQCQRALGDAGYAINPDETALKMIPLASVEVSDEAADVNDALVEKLLELEDVDAVYTQ